MTDGLDPTCQEIVTEIYLSQMKKWIIVEGRSDEKLLMKKQFNEAPVIKVVCGWEYIDPIIREAADLPEKTVIGLVDKDYRHLLHEDNFHANIVVTDYRDIENVLFESNALISVLAESGSTTKLPKDSDGNIHVSEIRQRISCEALKLGFYRAYCYLNEIGIDFDNLKYSKFISKEHLGLNVDKLLKHLKDKPKNHTLPVEETWNKSQSNWEKKDCLRIPVDVRHGHDLMEIVAISLQKLYGTQNATMDREEIESSFRMAISDEELQKYEFWKKIDQLLAM